MLTTMLVLQGVLVTYQAGHPLGREAWSDDGKVLTSQIELAGRKATVAIDRAGHTATVNGVPHVIPKGAVALENGSWAAYGIAAEEFASANKPTPIKVLVPAQGVLLDATIAVQRARGGRHVQVTIQGTTVDVDLGAKGEVVRAQIAAQKVEALPEGKKPTVAARRPPPKDVVEETLHVENNGMTLEGTLWKPKRARGKVPVAVIVAGSGPTDRDGNNAMGLATDAYRMLAEGLAKRGVATLRYDKRGVGGSVIGKLDPTKVTIEDFALDAAGWVEVMRTRFPGSKVTVIGHSEGGLIALTIADRADALVLVETPGRPIGEVMKEQLARQLPAKEMAKASEVLDAIRDGRPVGALPTGLDALFAPGIRTFLRSELVLDPAKLIAQVKAPVTIVQGTTDVQVSVDDAKRLAGAQPAAKLVVIEHGNHVLKEEATASPGQESYHDATKPLVSGVVEAVAGGVAR